METSATTENARSTAAGRLRLVSILETLSFIGLLFMMFTENETGVSILGAIHGMLFLAYAIIVLKDREVFGWSIGFTAVAILTGPLGAILVLERLRKEPSSQS